MGTHLPTRSQNCRASPVLAYAKDLANSAKGLIAHVLHGEVDPNDIAKNDGAIVTINGEKAAAYRDARGKLHVRSAACTHVGCVVSWNEFECCWDCPCHGSQFAPTGEVLQAPALAPLSPSKMRKR